VQQVNQLLTSRKQMEKMMKQMGKGKLPALPPELTGGAEGAAAPTGRHGGKRRKSKGKSRAGRR